MIGLGWLTSLLLRRNPAMTASGAQRLVKLGLAGLAAIIATIAFIIWLNGQKEAAVESYKTEQEAKVAPAREQAAEQRLQDVIENSKNEGDLHRAIDQAPKPVAPEANQVHPAARALGCERLRKLGRIPPACRPQDGDGSEARPG